MWAWTHRAAAMAAWAAWTVVSGAAGPADGVAAARGALLFLLCLLLFVVCLAAFFALAYFGGDRRPTRRRGRVAGERGHLGGGVHGNHRRAKSIRP